LIKLSDELAKVDALRDDMRFMAPFIERFTSNTGRSSIPMETYLRLMYPKFRYQMGYETLVRRSGTPLSGGSSAASPLTSRFPDSTLIKLTMKFGPKAVENLNKILVDKAREQRIVRGGKLRWTTPWWRPTSTTPPTPAYSRCVQMIIRTVKKIKEQEVAACAGFHDKTRSVRKRIFAIAKVLKMRTGETLKEVRQITGDIMEIAEGVAAQAEQVMVKAGVIGWSSRWHHR
jgi:hypothetical protein